MPLPPYSESKSTRETKAFRRGKHDRKKGKGKDMNPYVRNNIEHEPDLHEKWVAGWNVADTRIKNGDIEEYD